MWQIFIGSLVLSLIHASIPNHWIPLIAIGKTEKWTLRETLSATVITGLAHTLSTILIGVIVGLIGIKLSATYSNLTTWMAPAILAIVGTVYLIDHFRSHGHHHHHHADIDDAVSKSKTRTRAGILFSLSLAMFLTPCAEIEAYYFQAGMVGWKGIILVSAVYTLTTVLLMVLLVFAGSKGMRHIRSHALEHHEKLITGTVLIILAVVALFVKF